MSERNEFFAEAWDKQKHTWCVRRREGSICYHRATFQGPHAESDAREHVAKCNARTEAERNAREVKVAENPFYALPGVGINGHPMAAVYCRLPTSFINDFGGDDCVERATALAARLNAALAEPEPPKPPRYTVGQNSAGWSVLDSANKSHGLFWGADGEQTARDMVAMLNARAAEAEGGACPT